MIKKYAGFSEKRLFYNPPLLRFISTVSIAYLLYYLWWRATATLNPEALVFSWILWFAEAFGVFSYILFAWITQNVSPKYPQKEPLPGMTVDVFIPTYNESLEILEATLTGCKGIRYPHKTYVLDDGKRDEVKKLAARLGCQYITRATNEHAKAGNINHALQQTQGEFLVILDADMVPQPDFLDRTLGYFSNEKLAFIQLPQEFYNQDSIQHDRKFHRWHEQSLFFRVIQPGKNHSQSAFWCGSPSVVRRAALEDVGGVATDTITEDIHTSVRIHSRGWSSLFLNEELAFGIAPQTIQSFLLQRLRWAQGTMQLYRSKDSPLWITGLSFKQRISYLSSFLAYFESFQKLILILTPVFIILLNIFPMRVGVLPFLVHWVPYFLFNILANQVGGRGYFRYLQTEKYNILKMIVFVQSTFTLFNQKPLKFKVTPKSVDDTVYAKERRALRSYMGILGFVTGAIVYGLFKILSGSGVRLGGETFVIALFWATYNALIIFIGIWEILKLHHERKQYRFPLKLEADLYDAQRSQLVSRVQLRDISISGAGFSLQNMIPRQNKDLVLHFDTPYNRCILLPIQKIHREGTDKSGNLQMGVSFSIDTGVYRERLFEYLFIFLARSQFAHDAQQPRTIFVQPSPATVEHNALRLDFARVSTDGSD